TVESVLDRVRADPANFALASARRQVAEAHRTVHDLRARLERQAVYLVDLAGPAAVRRRSRQKVADRFDGALALVAPAVDRLGITISNGIPREIRSPAMFPAELTAVLLNLLTNALKAAGRDGRVRASAREVGSRVVLRMENTGAKVDLSDSERWFSPFE